MLHLHSCWAKKASRKLIGMYIAPKHDNILGKRLASNVLSARSLLCCEGANFDVVPSKYSCYHIILCLHPCEISRLYLHVTSHLKPDN
jgi:hypothetical protein